MIVVVHGLWFGSWAMRPLARRLAAHEGDVTRFDYRTTRGGLTEHGLALLESVNGSSARTLHFVAHSLGGLVVLKALSLAHEQGIRLPQGRVVLLGSPLRGSKVARRAQRIPGSDALLGKAQADLFQGYTELDLEHETGMIAGSKSIGLGLLFGTGSTPGDGTVLLEETRVNGLADHKVLPVTHTGMIFSKQVAAQTLEFISNGRFGL